MKSRVSFGPPSLAGVLLSLAFLLGHAAAEDAEEPSPPEGIHNPYFERTEWRVWRDDETSVEGIPNLVREGKETKAVAITLAPPPRAERLYPTDPPKAGEKAPYVVLEARPEPSPTYAGIWDDVYSSWSGLHGYMRTRWMGKDGSNVAVRGHMMDFVDVTKNTMMRAGVNFVHQSTTGMAHAIANGGMVDRTRDFEKLYFADVLVTAPAHASLTDHSPERSTDLYLAHVPTLFNSVGSSNSETMAITKMIIVGGYLPPATKLRLKRSGLYPSALLAIWKAALPYDVPYDHELRHRLAYKAVGNRADYPEKYGAAGIDRGDLALPYHQYDDGAHLRAMVDLARSMDVAPPEAVFTVIRVEGGRSVYSLRKSALVLQEDGQDVTLRVSVEGCYDLQGLPVTTRWTLLYGNRQTRVEPDPESPGVFRVTVPWDDALPGGRTAIALIANNGRYDGNPAILSVYRKKEALPGPGLGPGDYKFAGVHANRRPVLLGLQDRYVKRGKTLELFLRAVDPEGFPVSFFTRAGEVGDVDGNLLRWACPRKEAKGPRTVTVIASDGTSGNSYGGETVTIHVEKPTLLAQIEADRLTGPAPLTVKVSAKESIGPRGKLKYGWAFFVPSHKRTAKAFKDLVHGREAEHTFEKPGVYAIELTVQGPSGTDTETIGVWVSAQERERRPAALAVEGNGARIADGDERPSGFDHTDFGPVAVGAECVRVFCIVNAGDEPLTLDAKAPVRIEGEHARAFTLVQRPRRRLEGGGSTLFSLRGRPDGTGEHLATVTVRGGAQTHTFAVRCEGLAPAGK